MRITNTMLAQNSLRNISKNLERLNDANEKVTSESKIDLPSDDPTVATKAIRYQNTLSTTTQYSANASSASDWLNKTDDTLSDTETGLYALLSQARTYAVQAASSTLTDDDKATIKSSITNLKESILDSLNTQYDGRYIFGGYDTDTAPFTVESTAIGDVVKYKGKYVSPLLITSSTATQSEINNFVSSIDASEIYVASDAQTIYYNVGTDSEIGVNVEGSDLLFANSSYATATNSTSSTSDDTYQVALNIFNVLDQVELALNSSSITSQTNISIQGGTASASTSTAAENFALSIDGTSVSIAIPAGTSLTASYLQTAINNQLTSSSINKKVTVGTNSLTGALTIAADNSDSTYSTISSLAVDTTTSSASALVDLGFANSSGNIYDNAVTTSLSLDSYNNTYSYSKIDLGVTNTPITGTTTPIFSAGDTFTLTISEFGSATPITETISITADITSVADLQKLLNKNANISGMVNLSTNSSGQLVVATANNNISSIAFTNASGNLLGTTGTSTATTTSTATPSSTNYFTLDGNTDEETTADKKKQLESMLTDFDACLSVISSVQADVGARENYVTRRITQLTSDKTSDTSLLSKNIDVDTVEATTKASTAQYVYTSSLSVTSSVIKTSLVDYLS